MKFLEYNEVGEIVACYDIVPIASLTKVIKVSNESAEAVLAHPMSFRVVEGALEQRTYEEVVVKKRITTDDFANGILIDDVHYATSATALALLSLQTKNIKALVHTVDGDALREIRKEDKDKLIAALLVRLESKLI